MNNQEKLQKLQNLKNAVEKSSKKASSEKFSARQKLMSLFDEGSFIELFGFDTDENAGQGVVTGYGSVDGRLVYAYVHNSAVLGGAIGVRETRKILNVLELAEKTGAPVVSVVDSNGVKIEEGIDVLNSLGKMFSKTAALSGVIPQISVVIGACAGGSVFVPASSDFVFVVDKLSGMYLTGPAVTQGVTGVMTDSEALGGAKVCAQNGTADFYFENESDCFAGVRGLISLLPSNNLEFAVDAPSDDINRISASLNGIVADDGAAYDVKAVISEIADNNAVTEVGAMFAENMVTAFIRLNGATVGVVANQPAADNGVIDIKASKKAAAFISKCDSFNIPVVTFVDTDGFAIGAQFEADGISKYATELLYAYASATVPKVTVVLRKAYGSAYMAMCSKAVGADVVFAYPTAEIAVMPAEGAANLLYNDEIAAAKNPRAARTEKIQEFKDVIAAPYYAAAKGYVDDVIEPESTRPRIISALEMLAGKRVVNIAKKHGNI